MSEIRDDLKDIRHNLGLMESQFKTLFPTKEHVDRFVRVVMTAVQQNPKLLNPELRAAFYAACMKCAQDGLMPDGQEAALIPYLGRAPTVQYQPMLGGMLKKLRNSGELVGAPKIHVWKENDEVFDYQLGDEEKIVHKPALTARGKTIGAYSIVTLKNGGTTREVMLVDEIEAIRRRGRSPDEGPWVTDFDEMAKKTVFRRHYKKLPKSSDLDNVLKSDDETFVPYQETKEPGTGLATTRQQAGAGVASQAAQPQRSPALAAVAAHGGTPLPQQGVPAQGEKVVQGETVTEGQQGAQKSGPPADIL